MIIFEILVTIILVLLAIGYFVLGFFAAIILYDDSENKDLKKHSWIMTPLITVFWLPGIFILAIWCLFDASISFIINVIRICINK